MTGSKMTEGNLVMPPAGRNAAQRMRGEWALTNAEDFKRGGAADKGQSRENAERRGGALKIIWTETATVHYELCVFNARPSGRIES